jgi:hypothetical protein
VGLALVVLLVGGGVAIVAIDRTKMARLLREAFKRHGLPESWGEAIGRTESNLVSTAKVLTGSDGARGGAFGATQITWKTLEAHNGGPVGFTPEQFLASPELQAEWSARIMKAGHPLTIEDAGSWWNAGRARFADLGSTHVTRVQYVPRLRANLAKSQA